MKTLANLTAINGTLYTGTKEKLQKPLITVTIMKQILESLHHW